MVDPDQDREGLAWQTGVWNRISDIYLREIDQRFAPVVGAVIARADLSTDKDVLDLGTGTGAVAERAAVAVRPNGRVVDVDISPEMLALARKRATARGLGNLKLLEGRAESIPADDKAFNVAARLPHRDVRDRPGSRRARDCTRPAARWTIPCVGVGGTGAMRHCPLPANSRQIRWSSTSSRRWPRSPGRSGSVSRTARGSRN